LTRDISKARITAVSRQGRFLLSVAGALVFGLLVGLVHGNHGGLRAAFGNLSAPWLFVALVPAWWAGSAVRGALLGTSATLVALAGFYASLTATMYGHLGETHGVVQSFVFVLEANRIWFAAGLMSGPVCGTVSGFFGARLRTAWLAAVLGVLLIGEIVVVRGLQGVELPPLHLRWTAADWRAYEIEATLGLLLLAGLLARRLRAAR
jgi:hypothetical protein